MSNTGVIFHIATTPSSGNITYGSTTDPVDITICFDSTLGVCIRSLDNHTITYAELRNENGYDSYDLTYNVAIIGVNLVLTLYNIGGVPVSRSMITQISVDIYNLMLNVQASVNDVLDYFSFLEYTNNIMTINNSNFTSQIQTINSLNYNTNYSFHYSNSYNDVHIFVANGTPSGIPVLTGTISLPNNPSNSVSNPLVTLDPILVRINMSKKHSTKYPFNLLKKGTGELSLISMQEYPNGSITYNFNFTPANRGEGVTTIGFLVGSYIGIDSSTNMGNITVDIFYDIAGNTVDVPSTDELSLSLGVNNSNSYFSIAPDQNASVVVANRVIFHNGIIVNMAIGNGPNFSFKYTAPASAGVSNMSLDDALLNPKQTIRLIYDTPQSDEKIYMLMDVKTTSNRNSTHFLYGDVILPVNFQKIALEALQLIIRSMIGPSYNMATPFPFVPLFYKNAFGIMPSNMLLLNFLLQHNNLTVEETYQQYILLSSSSTTVSRLQYIIDQVYSTLQKTASIIFNPSDENCDTCGINMIVSNNFFEISIRLKKI